MIFHKWSAAMAVANGYAALTGDKYRVRRTLSGLWSVGRAGGAR